MEESRERKERLYAIAVLIAGFMIFGTACASDLNHIPFDQSIWQIVWSTLLGLFGWNGIRLEETRVAKRLHRGRYTIDVETYVIGGARYDERHRKSA